MPGKLAKNIYDHLNKTANWLFYAALTLELVLMIVEKSELPFPYESYVFRITFLLTFLAVIAIKRDIREWAVITVVLALAACSYVISGKNDMVRLALFIMAARNIDLKKTMKYTFYVCLVGFLTIVVLSVVGILGTVSVTVDYGRSAGVETRYVFGFGHPNTLFSSCYALLLMWLWIYGRKAGALLYAAMVVLTIPILYLTGSRTGIIIVAFTLFVAILIRLFKKLEDKRWPYVITAICQVFFSVLFPMFATWEAYRAYLHDGDTFLLRFYWTIDWHLNNRLSNLYYGADNGMAILYNWKLFAPRGNDAFFDVGWVRLFYWYGIIPTVIITIVIIAVVYQSMKERDIYTAILFVSLGIYTLVEATFVTRYLGRDFFILIAGVYLGRLFDDIFTNGSDTNLRGTNDAGEI